MANRKTTSITLAVAVLLPADLAGALAAVLVDDVATGEVVIEAELDALDAVAPFDAMMTGYCEGVVYTIESRSTATAQISACVIHEKAEKAHRKRSSRDSSRRESGATSSNSRQRI